MHLKPLLLGAPVWLAAVQSGLGFCNPATGRWPNRDPAGAWFNPNLNAMLRNAPPSTLDILGLAEACSTCGGFCDSRKKKCEVISLRYDKPGDKVWSK